MIPANCLRSAARLAIVSVLAGAGAATAGVAVQPLTVATYHGDAMRTGWNDRETVLTPAVVGGNQFGRLGAVVLDSQVDAQPLYLAGRTIAGGVHNVVYAATEANSIYAIDADSGQTLVTANFGKPVPMGSLPGACNNNAPTVGITSTPVIDPAAGMLYAIAYAMESGSPVYRLHALDLATLADKIPSVVVSAGRTLTDGTTYRFNPAASRQRAALLEANGTIYAGFSSFCDVAANVSRGWLLAWQAGSLKPLPVAELSDRQATAPNAIFLNSIWMSGFGIAADEAGSLLFTTSNSDPGGTTYARTANLAESVIKLSPDLRRVQSLFSPDAPGVDVTSLDAVDEDFGSGGVTVLPQQPGARPRLAVAAGKAGLMYLLNRDNLGGFYDDEIDHVLDTVTIGPCWCGASYFQGADGIGRVVSSGGANAEVWRVMTGGARPKLAHESSSEMLPNGQEGGFFTTVSSNGTQANSQVIWAVSRPASAADTTVKLYAFNPSAYNLLGHNQTLFSGPAGKWTSSNNNATIVPLVANGRVYVAANRTLTIFGLKGGTAITDLKAAPALDADSTASPPGHAVYGTLVSANSRQLALRTRSGITLTVDETAAISNHSSALPVLGRTFLVRGTYDAKGVLHATSVIKAKPSSALWPEDR